MSTLTSHYYQGLAEAGKNPALAIVFSVTFHAALLLGYNQPWGGIAGMREKPEPGPIWTQVDLKDEPDSRDVPKPLDDPPAAPSVAVPMLPDPPVVTLTRSEFLQEPDPVTIQPGDVTKLTSIPHNIRRGPDTKDISRIFDPIDLDKKPEPISRPSPTFPYDLQHEVAEGSVVVGFIVDKHGDVVQAHIVSSSNPGFERAALTAIEKWKFRPGVKNHQKVSTRVEQPLAFVLKDDR